MKCKNYGEIDGKGGKTANEVCCSCGGGANEQLALVVDDNNNQKAKYKTQKVIASHHK